MKVNNSVTNFVKQVNLAKPTGDRHELLSYAQEQDLYRQLPQQLDTTQYLAAMKAVTSKWETAARNPAFTDGAHNFNAVKLRTIASVVTSRFDGVKTGSPGEDIAAATLAAYYNSKKEDLVVTGPSIPTTRTQSQIGPSELSGILGLVPEQLGAHEFAKVAATVDQLARIESLNSLVASFPSHDGNRLAAIADAAAAAFARG